MKKNFFFKKRKGMKDGKQKLTGCKKQIHSGTWS